MAMLSAKSVPDAVREVILGNHVYLQSLQLGIANYTALAQRIKPEVEKIIGTKVNVNTVVVAIKRFADTLGRDSRLQEADTSLKGARMSLTSNIIDVNFQKEFEDILDMLDNLFEKNRYSLFQTDQHFRLFTEDIEEIRSIIDDATKKFDGRIREGLAKINIQLASGEQNPYNILSTVSNILYNNQISIQDAFFTPNEVVLIVNDKDAARAYELLRAKMK